jgi:hypothetical protein
MQHRAIQKLRYRRAAVPMASISARCTCRSRFRGMTEIMQPFLPHRSARNALACRSARPRRIRCISGFPASEASPSLIAQNRSPLPHGRHSERIAAVLPTRSVVLQPHVPSPEFMTKTVAKSATERWRKHDPLDSTYGFSRVVTVVRRNFYIPVSFDGGLRPGEPYPRVRDGPCP